MSNKITLATIQFRADAKGVNPTLDAMRQSSKDAHDEIDKLQQSLDKGIKTMKDVNGVEFNVANKIKELKSLANGYDQAVRELMKGATALESVVKNIELGTIEKNSRAELKGAINAANSRLRSIREMAENGTIDEESLQRQRELNIVITESQKQLNNLDRDTKKVIETIEQGGVISESVLNKEMKGLKDMLALIPKGTEEWNQYNAQLQTIETHVASIRKQEREAATTLLSSQNLGGFSEEQIRSAINSGKELLATYKTASPEAKALADNIVRAEQYLKNYGVEAARVAAREAAALKEQEQAEKQLQVTMNKRTASIKALSALSADALAETQKYWQAQRDGAERGTPAFEKAEAVLKRIDNLQRKRKVEQLDSVLGDPSKFGVAEVKNAVQEMERLRDSVQKGIPIWQHYNKMVEQGKAYLDSLAKTEAAERINQQMQNLTTLSTQGLQEVKKYWETMVAGAKYGSTELGTYKSMLEQVLAEEQQRANLTARAGSNILQSSNLGMYSEKEIRAAIEAGQQLIKTYQTANPKAQKLAEDIVRAERHLEQYGVAAERTAQKEADAVRKAADEREKTNQLMENQLKRDTGLTQTALKAQEQYWQRLIDDPKAAADSLARYYENLNKVRAIQKEQEASATKANGLAALNRFRGDVDYENKVSANQLKEDREALKKYRDSLPQEGNLSILREIDYYLGKTGETAEKAAQQTMKLPEAMQLAGRLGTKGFAASTDQLKQAKKALEEARDAAGRGTKEFSKYQAAINKVDLELAKTGELSAEVNAVLNSPKGKSFNELKQAVEQGRQALANMRTETEKDKKDFDELAAKVKAADFEMKALGNSSKGTATAFDKAWSRLKTYIGLYMGAAVAIQKLVGALGDLMELSDKMGEVRKTTGYSADEVGRLSDSLAKLDTRTPIQELLGLSAAAGQLGLKAQDDVRGFTEAANKLIVALPEMGRESATSLMKIANATGDLKRNGDDVQETLERVGSTIIALRANSASAAPAITDFVSRVGAVGAQAGITIDQIAAMGSTIDALGGRVEMSATALSRMIPAIRNNMFAVANAIGMTEKELKKMSSMEQMITIFRKMRESIKGIDTSTEEGMNQMADNVEALLSKNATMAEVMKELNQQGARAGIVFGLMSQNVDELERQLGIASKAYEQNVSLMNEYNNMNETAAAQWARLKNQLEEMFVSDKMQRNLTWIIKRLRDIVDLISMDGPLGDAIRYGLIYLGLLRAKWSEAIGSGIISIFKFLAAVRAATAATVADTAAKTANAAATEAVATATADAAVKTNIFAKAWGKMSEAMKANVVTAVAMAVWYLGSKLLDMHHEAKAAAEAMRNLKEKTDEEKSAVEKLFKPLRDANLQEEEKRKLINAINSQYGTYLSKMLTEASNAQEIARAYEAINLQLEKKNTLEGMNANRKNVEEKKKGKLDSSFSALDKYIIGGSSNLEEGARLTSDITGIIKKGIEDGLSRAQVEEKVGDLLKQRAAGGQLKEQTLASGQGRADWVDTQNLIKSAALSYFDTQQSVEKEVKQVNKRLQADLDNITKSVREAADDDIPELIQSFDKALSKGKDAKKYSAEESTAVVNAFDAIKAYYDLHKDELADYQKILLNSKMETSIKDFRDKAYAFGGGGGGGGTNPYGDYNKVTSPYEDWNASDLVNRRKEMLERVKALAAGADVQAVLSEDAKFITETTRQNIKTTKDAIEWYNTERLKIQDALHEKHLTNSGDWMDPKKGGRKASKLVQDEMKYYLDELDAYYTERKASIQEARNDEEISEAEARNRTLANEAEWHQRRANLQKLYSKQRKEVADEEEKAIFDIISERTGDTTDYIKKDIKHTINFIEKVGSEKGKPAMDKILGDIDLGIEKDFLRQRNAIGQHLKAIEDIINKENPFNGIVENLRKNLGTMDILLADIKKEEERTVDKEIERTMFIMEQATKGYGLTWEQMMRDMAKRGWQAWADAIQNDTAMQTGLMHQVTKVFEQIQDAIKKEASELKKQAEIMWSNILLPGGDGRTTVKDAFEQTIGALGIQEGRVSRANSLIGAGQASERVADKLAIQQLKVQLAMQQYQYNLMRKQGQEKIAMLHKEAKMYEDIGDMEKARALRMQADNAAQALNLATRKEQTEELKMQEQIIARTEESQARLYKELREWGDLIASSVQSVMEASNTGNAEYYNEKAKLALTGETKGSQQYIIIDNAGTSDATAHYETLSETQALERQHEIEQQNATAEAWKKVMDDINQKMNDMITDQMNAMLQNQSIDLNTDATKANTEAILGLTSAIGSSAGQSNTPDIDTSFASQQNLGDVMSEKKGLKPSVEFGPFEHQGYDNGPDTELQPLPVEHGEDATYYQDYINASNEATDVMTENAKKQAKAQEDTNKKITASTQSAFAKMTQAANLYGIAYQAMSNDNLSAAQKFGMIAVQAAGNAAITALTTNLSEATGEAATSSATVWGKLWSQLGWWAIPVYALFTGTLGGLMGLAASKIAKSKSEIASATGANNSVASGRLTTGMLTYAEGNVNEFTDPDTLTPGKSYNVDAADGKTYRAKYMGKGAKTHITNGPEFHLAGEAGREMIIDAGTTRQITMNEREIWQAIQTLSGGGRLRRSSARRGIGAFASGNLDDFEDEMVNGQSSMVNGGDMDMGQMLSLQASIDRQSDLLEDLRINGIKATFDVYGKGGLVDSYDTGKKTVNRYGQRY